MKSVLVTGGKGFLGRNLVAHLRERKDCSVSVVDQEDTTDTLNRALLSADIVFHLAGVNRPTDPLEFQTGNVQLTEEMCRLLLEKERRPKVIFSSSIQAELENEYGKSKRLAEDALCRFGSQSGASIHIYRLKNLFGKWCRPNYNSVTATFCYNIARDLPISISDPSRTVDLSYVDDVISAFLGELQDESRAESSEPIRSCAIALGDLAGRIQAFHELRSSLKLPDFGDWFNRALYATYLSYLPATAREYRLSINSDNRGSLAEFVKQSHFGQVFVSRTKPGVTRGNHYHHTKTEKFFVVEGNALIKMRPIEGGSVDKYFVDGSSYQVIDIPPGYTHSITNVGTSEMVTLFWASEIFDPKNPDTYYMPVEAEHQEHFSRSETV